MLLQSLDFSAKNFVSETAAERNDGQRFRFDVNCGACFLCTSVQPPSGEGLVAGVGIWSAVKSQWNLHLISLILTSLTSFFSCTHLPFTAVLHHLLLLESVMLLFPLNLISLVLTLCNLLVSKVYRFIFSCLFSVFILHLQTLPTLVSAYVGILIIQTWNNYVFVLFRNNFITFSD